ncbi:MULTISPECIES: hypothetical protein [Sanguibacteroides]|nr:MULTISPECIES: hypothetical protein [Sanguibacteroides]
MMKVYDRHDSGLMGRSGRSTYFGRFYMGFTLGRMGGETMEIGSPG